VTFVSILGLAYGLSPKRSLAGMVIAIAALLVMPWLASRKRRLACLRADRALAADAAQSATCAYLAGSTLIGLVANAWLHLRWIDPVAGLIAVPFLIVEGRQAMRGDGCGCC
jgi:divalent metal cation (Fe/Co/Zn/Cd) transporter